MRREPGRLTFPYDWLLDQVLDGRKTASVLRPGETNYGADPRDDAVRVGGEYDACDTSGTPCCRIRVTEMRELRWGEPIPERLWRAEACASEEEFRRDHHEWFSQPDPEYAFRAFWFERIASIVLALTLCVSSAFVAAPAFADEDRPRLANEYDVVGAVMRPMMELGLVADGTVFVGVMLRPDGGAEVRDVYGGVAANPDLERLVLDAVRAARFTVPSQWLATGSDRGWAMFWTFRSGDCQAWSYDAPARATLVRICVPVHDSKVTTAGASYVVDGDPPPERTGLPKMKRLAGNVIAYPRAGHMKRAEGYVAMRLTVDETGHIESHRVLADTAGEPFREWLERWRSEVRFEIPDGWPGPGVPRTVDVRLAFGVAPRGGAECPWVLPSFDGHDVRVCAARIYARH